MAGCSHASYGTSISAKKAIARMAGAARKRRVGKAERCEACGKWKVTV